MARDPLEGDSGGGVVKGMKRAVCALACAAMATGSSCGIDALVFDKITADKVEKVPGAGQHTVSGASTAVGGGAQVAFLTSAGVPLPDYATVSAGDGSFQAIFPATDDAVNTIVTVTSTTRTAWGMIPLIPRKSSVWDPDLAIALGDSTDMMDDLGVDSTTLMLMVLGLAKYGTPPTPLSSITPDAAKELLVSLAALLRDGDDRVVPLHEMVARLFGDDATIKPPFVAFPAAGESHLDIAALASGMDYDGDGAADTSTEAFDLALQTAVGAGGVDTCFPDDRIRVVMMVDFNGGGVDRNCAPIDRWKWTTDQAGRRMFIVGALHPDTPNCDTDPAPCIDSATFDEFSQKLGNWTPNTAPMYDDGTNGDLVAGDNVWTLALDLPWFDAGAIDARWVRIHYKYTWGNPGQLWTTTEEWPGNSRLLELRDVNGDRIVARYDLYGDETTNKDLANLLAPANGGCGKVLWASEHPPEKCANDTTENMIDTDGDCVLDTYPPPGSAGPLTVDCP